jgi:hypothetical protein
LVENQVLFDWQKVNQLSRVHEETIDWLGKRWVDDEYDAREKCTVVGEVNSALRLDFVSQARAEQNLDVVSALLLSPTEGLISPRNQRGGIIILFAAD